MTQNLSSETRGVISPSAEPPSENVFLSQRAKAYLNAVNLTLAFTALAALLFGSTWVGFLLPVVMVLCVVISLTESISAWKAQKLGAALANGLMVVLYCAFAMTMYDMMLSY